MFRDIKIKDNRVKLKRNLPLEIGINRIIFYKIIFLNWNKKDKIKYNTLEQMKKEKGKRFMNMQNGE